MTVVEIPEFEDHEEFKVWIRTLDNPTLKRIRLYYYDLWTWESNNETHRKLFDHAEEELNRRAKSIAAIQQALLEIYPK